LNDRVIFAGFVPHDELPAHYSCADAMATASMFETQGFTVQEAMSCGTPVACANGRAFKDYVHDGENGYLFETTEEECAAAMKKAMNAPDSVKEAARKTAMSYGIVPTTERLVEVYELAMELQKKRKGSE